MLRYAKLFIEVPSSHRNPCFQNFCTSVLALAQSVVSCVKLICERLAVIEPPKLTEAVYEFRRACKTATQPEVETSSFYSSEVKYT